jgi:hypothetical protein
MSADDLSHIIRIIRDMVMFMFSAAIFIPAVVWLLRQEQISPMKFKHIGFLIFCVGYSFYSVGSTLVGFMSLFQMSEAKQVDLFLQPIIYTLFALLIFLLIPHRGMVFALYPVRLWTYYKLRWLQLRIQQFVRPQSAERHLYGWLMNPAELELTIYRTTIWILDNYALLREDRHGGELYSMILEVTQSSKDYGTLIKALARLA